MIKNIVFDLGGVLIDFRPEKYLEHIGFNEKEIKKFRKIVFGGKEWMKYDSSEYDAKQLEEILVQNYPKYEKEVRKIFKYIDYSYILSCIKDTSDYLKQLKNKGYKIYILSDLSKDSYNHNKKYDFFNYVDGGVYSFEIGSTKPNKENYKTLLEKYNLIPEETIFIDDKLENIQAANILGIRGIQFTKLVEVKEKINELEKV